MCVAKNPDPILRMNRTGSTVQEAGPNPSNPYPQPLSVFHGTATLVKPAGAAVMTQQLKRELSAGEERDDEWGLDTRSMIREVRSNLTSRVGSPVWGSGQSWG